jgi:hypothetical protein
MILSNCAIEKMGFTEHTETDELEISFGIIKAYSIRGVVFEKDCERKESRIASFGVNCTSVISQSINDACQLLIGDVFVDDEQKWLSDNKASPPFFLVYFRESTPRLLRGGYRQEINGDIHTYDAFPEGKVEIRNWENDVELRIITALSAHLSTLQRQVQIVPVARSIFGKTSDGKTLLDIKLSGSVQGYVSSPKSLDSIGYSLDQAEQLFGELTKDTSRHFYAALNEKDRMKKFLYFFMFIERYTHRTFKSLSYERNVKQLFFIQQRMGNTASGFFSTIFSESNNLAHRFFWCAMTAWGQLGDQDVCDFLELKKVRDKLAHGEHIEESDLPVEKAKMLGLKLLGTKQA